MSDRAARPLRVLIVEDTFSVASLLDHALSLEGMLTEVATSGADAMRRKPLFRPDVVLLDLGLPDVDGFELMQRFVEDDDCGLIVVTANDGEGTRIAGLETGADDYIVKPPMLKELAARIRAVHRRLSRPEGEQAPAPVQGTRIILDAAQRTMTGPSQVTTPLTEAEFAALECLLEADGASVSREWLGKIALKRTLSSDDRSVDQLVLKLRRKLALHGIGERAILSSRGTGYMVPEPTRFIISMPSHRSLEPRTHFPA